MNKYKTWDGATRQRMYARLKRDEKKGELPSRVKLKGPCELCSEELNTMPHAEEYGPTYEDYLDSLHVLCPRCHGMLHLRYRHPDKWEQYKQHIRKLKSGKVPKLIPLRNMNQLYQKSKSWVRQQFDTQEPPSQEWWELLKNK